MISTITTIEDLTTGPISAGIQTQSNLLVEFDPASQWYNSSLTIAAGWIKSGGVTSYNVFAQPPENARLQLKNLGLDVEALEKDEKLRITDWYKTHATFFLEEFVRGKYYEDPIKR